MHRLVLTLLITVVPFLAFLHSQTELEIEGMLKIQNVPNNVDSDSLLILGSDGIVGHQSKEAIHNRTTQQCASGYYIIPADFDFTNIPATHANAIWEIRHCHNLANGILTLPQDVILSFKGGKFINFQNIIGNRTGIDAFSQQIFDGNALTGTWSLEHVNVCWFGAKADQVVDSEPAFTKATEFANMNEGIRRILIPSGKYHLANPWRITASGNLWNPISVDGYGAVLDNTVVVATRGIGVRGLTVDGAPRHGFVFLRGQGASHDHLLASNCGLDGFYCGSDIGNGDYGANFQVTRTTFTSLTALNNGRHGWFMEAEATANRSWFNANSVIGFAAVSNAEKGFAWTGGSGPNGVSQMNYNSFFNINCEGNGDISVDLPESRANTFIGGHYVDSDANDFCMRLGGPFNVNLGGRYVGKVEEPAFIYANTSDTSEGGIVGRMNGVDEINVKDLHTEDLEVSNEPFIPLGWSIIPKDRESYVVAADQLNNHQFSIDLSGAPTADGMMLRLTRFGQRNFANGFDQKYSFALLIHLTTSSSNQTDVQYIQTAEDQFCTVNSVTFSSGILTIDFNTDYLIFGAGFGVTEYQNSKSTDFR
jgi:hypothetical protein